MAANGTSEGQQRQKEQRPAAVKREAGARLMSPSPSHDHVTLQSMKEHVQFPLKGCDCDFVECDFNAMCCSIPQNGSSPNSDFSAIVT